MEGLIPLVECPSCNHTGRPGEEHFTVSGDGNAVTVHCDCGTLIKVDDARDQFILSKNSIRISGTSNYFEKGHLTIESGKSVMINFRRPIDIISNVSLTPNQPVIVAEHHVSREGMTILSSAWVNGSLPEDTVSIDWAVEGLIELDSLPIWYVVFYNATVLGLKGFHKAALVEYEIAFEAFIGSLLKNALTERFGKDAADYMLGQTRRIEDRCTSMLKFAIDHKLSECARLYSDWQRFVQEPRNKIMHGSNLPVSKEDSEQAHQIIYQAIRWIQKASGAPEHPLGVLKWRGMAGTYSVPAGSTSVEIKFPKPIDSI
jgi:hypothetical protein